MTMEKEMLKHLKQRPSTLVFPYEKNELVEGMRNEVSWKIEKCIGCSLCVKICPSSAIQLVGKGKKSDIIYDLGRCIFCGECVDICPTKAIHAKTELELVFTNYKDMTKRFRRSRKVSSKPRE